MPRYDDRRGGTRLYVGHLSSRTRSRDLEDMFSRYGRVRDVDMKRDYAFVEFSDPRDADDARYALNGRDMDGSRMIVEFAKGVPRGSGGSRDYPGRGPTPGSGRCFNCGIDGHWARDCKAGDWKNKCYRCGERGHIERNCQNSPKKLSRRPRSYSRSPSPYRGRSRSRSYSRGRSDSRSRSPVKRDRSYEREDRISRSPKRHKGSPSPSQGRKHSPAPDERRPQEGGGPSPKDRRHANGSDYSASPRGRSRSPDADAGAEDGAYRSSRKENGHSRSLSPPPRDDRSPVYDDDDDDDNHASTRRGESN
ncbi:serine/arginine-rich splicing factor RS2Z32 isoform X1 [Gossypium raimondii]|uniref:Serine/arginine-rich splicing factor RS2Z32 n=3 Tax=Gossypium raimondii TaxID=29730 RepID=A0A0D2TTF4_GOSRA|nr:serine/arginine-rich splicing factor RS2Z32 isoform X1 [Gossypium raimondii]KJB78861.1 hypothetical protein B456_013G024100 [Gossypium raimondii]KJB78868.1 hypothetical protein B456_013G024100 [Gossypium raimondii]